MPSSSGPIRAAIVVGALSLGLGGGCTGAGGYYDSGGPAYYGGGSYYNGYYGRSPYGYYDYGYPRRYYGGYPYRPPPQAYYPPPRPHRARIRRGRAECPDWSSDFGDQ